MAGQEQDDESDTAPTLIFIAQHGSQPLLGLPPNGMVVVEEGQGCLEHVVPE